MALEDLPPYCGFDTVLLLPRIAKTSTLSPLSENLALVATEQDSCQILYSI